MNLYCRLPHLQAEVGGGSTLQDQYLRAIEAASREVDHYCNRRFYSEVATRYFDGNGRDTLRLSPVPGEADLLSVTALTVDENDDGTYETTLVAGTDYRLLPVNSMRKDAIQLLTRGTQLGTWPRGQDAVKVVGKWGYSEDTDSIGITGTVADTSTTTLTGSGSATGLVFPGDTLIIGSEQMYVSAVAGTAITVTRGVNGTTAAAHAGAAIYVRRYPADIEEAVRIRVASGRWEANQGTYMLPDGDPGSFPRYRGLLAPFRLLGVA